MRTETNTLYVALGDTLAKMSEEDFDEVTVIKKIDGISFLRGFPWFDLQAKSTGLTAGLLAPGFFFEQDGKRHRWLDIRAGREWVLAPGQEAKITYEDRRCAYELSFTPVTFKNHLKGFQVVAIDDGSAGGYTVVTNTVYVALSDTPVLVGAIDVEGIDVETATRREKERLGRKGKEIVDIVKFLNSHGWADISVTSAGLTFMFNPSDQLNVIVEQDGERHSASDYMARNERLVVTPANQETKILLVHKNGDTLTEYTLVPVSFRNQLRGFRVIVGQASAGKVGKSFYTALSDTPVQVREEDVTKEN